MLEKDPSRDAFTAYDIRILWVRWRDANPGFQFEVNVWEAAWEAATLVERERCRAIAMDHYAGPGATYEIENGPVKEELK